MASRCQQIMLWDAFFMFSPDLKWKMLNPYGN
jgi:hypothetical protein